MAATMPTSGRSERAIESVTDKLSKALTAKGLQLGSSIFIRIFKDPGVLEVWVEDDKNTFTLFRNYPICYFSGNVGPKTNEGDNQSPEGFYFVNPQRMNPWSKFHLSFNLGYPNVYDRKHGRTGSALMVHGNCVSIGCFAMTDPFMSEIYTLADAALRAGQPFFRVHAFPFRLESEILSKYRTNEWYYFWLNLKEGYDYFVEHKIPPNASVEDQRYVFGE